MTYIYLPLNKKKSIKLNAFNNILPIFGKMLSKDASAYTYLPMSVNAFPDGEDFKKVMTAAGFQHNTSKSLTFGICSLYTGVKA